MENRLIAKTFSEKAKKKICVHHTKKYSEKPSLVYMD